MVILSVASRPWLLFLSLSLLLFIISRGGVDAFGILQQQSPARGSDATVQFVAHRPTTRTATTHTILQSSASWNDDASSSSSWDANEERRNKLKRELLQLGASFDRGFGASPRARTKVEQVLLELENLNPEDNAARGISGGSMDLASPLQGNWRMVWTTAPDVLSLAVNPVVTVGAIYQLFEPPIVTNVIDLLPRIQNLLPPSLVPNSLLRANVKTRASARDGYPMRIGLDFEAVSLEPVELLGQVVRGVLPPLGFDLPKLFDLPDDVGYFDVSYLDEEILIIRQNEPGGLFVLTRVDDADP